MAATVRVLIMPRRTCNCHLPACIGSAPCSSSRGSPGKKGPSPTAIMQPGTRVDPPMPPAACSRLWTAFCVEALDAASFFRGRSGKHSGKHSVPCLTSPSRPAAHTQRWTPEPRRVQLASCEERTPQPPEEYPDTHWLPLGDASIICACACVQGGRPRAAAPPGRHPPL